MTLQINVNLPPRLIERAREQQSERRLAKVAEQRQAVVRKEAARQLTVQRALVGKDAKGNDLRAGAVADDERKRPVLAHQVAKYAFIIVCNVNEKKDDVFELLIDGEVAGIMDFSADGAPTAYLFRWAVNQAKDDIATDAVNRYFAGVGALTGKMQMQEPSRAITRRPTKGSKTDLRFRNTSDNNNNNFGNIIWGFVGSSTSDPDKVAISGECYQAPSGQDFSLQIKWSELKSVTETINALQTGTGVQTISIAYRWTNGTDLDTITTIAALQDKPVGWATENKSNFMSWTGDDTSGNGLETVSIDVTAIRKIWPGKTKIPISLAANWYAVPSSTPITISITIDQAGQSKTTTYSRVITLFQQGGPGQSCGVLTVGLDDGTVALSDP